MKKRRFIGNTQSAGLVDIKSKELVSLHPSAEACHFLKTYAIRHHTSQFNLQVCNGNNTQQIRQILHAFSKS
jgi:hypothetical protein